MSAKCPFPKRTKSGQKADKRREEKSGEENTKESIVSPESSADASRPPSGVFLLSKPYKKAQTSYTSYTSYGVTRQTSYTSYTSYGVPNSKN